ncbi:MAG: aminotransferase class V-fold PLP-dependent enzyme [Candidatus Neomarinimicrobiota bacterium]|nr:aminotransferase class V-fold PLP-dependent enzyme [Candidatus Neomarinimicrobiota bacterium]
MHRIYLDNQSTTQVDPDVMKKMTIWFTKNFGNASSNTHAYGWEAQEAINIAREQIANQIGADSSEIIFTSGATESINIAIKGFLKDNLIENPHIITLKTEHSVVLDTFKSAEKNGVDVTYLDVLKNGLVDILEIEKAIKENTILISILHGNNEIGVIQPIKKIGEIAKKNKVIFHVDGAQTLGKIQINMQDLNIDMFSMSAHKLYGPKGVGALYIRQKNPRVKISPIITGGMHERGIRPGTLPVPLIVGFGEAVKLSGESLDNENQRIMKLRDKLISGLEQNMIKFFINGDMKNRLVGNLSLSFPHIKNKLLISRMRKISVSAGSACTSLSHEPSHVLKAIGHTDELAYSTIRVGIGRFNTFKDIDMAIKVITDTINDIKIERKTYEFKS